MICKMKIFLILITAFLPLSVICKDYYTAAVFEHRPRSKATPDSDPKEVKYANLKYFEKATQIAAKNKADIIVFNEYGALPYPGTRENIQKFAEHIPDPKKYKINPCSQKAEDTFSLTFMSCLAQEHNIYLVGNLIDIQPCQTECDAHKIEACETKCSDDGFLVYNTDVAFDREGNLIARYHKIHPYFEIVNSPEKPEFITFDTEFGRFGLIVCFDSVFVEALNLVKEYNVDTLLFPTYWFDDIMPLNAVEFQQSWSLAHSVNFLAANAQKAATGTLGSGIYSKYFGALVYTYENDNDSKLLIANVPLKENANVPVLNLVNVIREDEVFLKVETGEKFPTHYFDKFNGPAKDSNDYRCFKSQSQNFTLSKLENSAGSIESCNNGFCCTLKYETDNLEDTWYLIAKNGTNNVYDYYYWWEESCILMRCDPFEGKDCVMHPSTSKTVFETLELKATFNAQRIYPTVTKDKFRLASKSEWNYLTKGSETILTFNSDSKTPLLKAALVGRNYERDPQFVPFYQYSLPDLSFLDDKNLEFKVHE